MFWWARQSLLKGFLKYLGLGVCITLLTVFLALGASPTAARIPRLNHPSDSPIAQSSTHTGSWLVQQGRELYDTGQFAQAATIWKQAAAAFAAQGDSLNQAMVLRNLALVYQQLGQLPEATQAINESLSLLNQFEPLTNDGLIILAQALNTRGSLQLAQGQSEAALNTWEQATEVYEQADNPEGEARSLSNRAIALRMLGFHPQAEQQLTRVSQLLNQQTDSLIRVVMLRNLGEVQRLIGNLEESRRLLDESLAIAKLEERQSPADISAVLMSLGNTLQALAQRREASAQRAGNLEEEEEEQDTIDALYQKALGSYAQAAANTPSRLAKIQAQLNQLSVTIKMQSWPEAQNLWGDIERESPHLLLSQSSIYAQISLAQSLMTYRQQVDSCNDATGCPSVQKIDQILSSAEQNAKALTDQRAESYALGYRGHLYEQQVSPSPPDKQLGHLDKQQINQLLSKAQNLTEEALILAQAIGARDVAYRWQWQLGRLYKIQEDSDKALAAYDAAFKNVRALRNELLFLTSDVQFTFRDQIEPLYREYVSLLLPSNSDTAPVDDRLEPGQAEITAITAQTVITDLRLGELENFLACSLFNRNGAEGLVGIDEIADEGQTAVIYPIILEDRMEVLLKLPNQKLYRHTIQKPEKGFEPTLKRLRRHLEQPFFSSKRGKPTAKQVYDWLIGWAEEDSLLDPEQTKTLVFILDGSLRKIPMAALYDGEKYLIEKYAIAISLGGLKLPESPPKTQFKALIAGLSEKPQFQNAEEAQFFGPLKFVDQEVNAVKDILPGAKVLLNDQFTSDTLKTEISASPYNVIHLATHGQFGVSRENTFILTAPPAEPGEDIKADLNELDDLLRVRDQAPIELLVLSACETATGDNREVLGIAGMAVQTGARSTLATLWSVDDSSTAELMQEFYKALTEEPVTKAEALRRAQRHLLQNSSAYKPSHWAPYVLVGDWR